MLKIILLSFGLLCSAQDMPHPSGHSTYKELKGQLFTFKMVPKDKTISLEVVGIPKLKLDFSKVDLEVKYLSQDKQVVSQSIPFSEERMVIPVKPGYKPDQIQIKSDERVLDTLKIHAD